MPEIVVKCHRLVPYREDATKPCVREANREVFDTTYFKKITKCLHARKISFARSPNELEGFDDGTCCRISRGLLQ